MQAARRARYTRRPRSPLRKFAVTSLGNESCRDPDEGVVGKAGVDKVLFDRTEKSVYTVRVRYRSRRACGIKVIWTSPRREGGKQHDCPRNCRESGCLDRHRRPRLAQSRQSLARNESFDPLHHRAVRVHAQPDRQALEAQQKVPLCGNYAGIGRGLGLLAHSLCWHSKSTEGARGFRGECQTLRIQPLCACLLCEGHGCVRPAAVRRAPHRAGHP